MAHEEVSIADENSCRFGKWFNEAAHGLLKGSSHISSITKHHATVHQGIKEAMRASSEGNMNTALEVLTKVEHSSEEGFIELLKAVKEATTKIDD